MSTEGQILKGRYEIKRLLKQGGMGAVFEGFDTLLNARVAIKENRVDDPAMRAAFEREAQLLANLQHASLPGCIDLLSEGGTQHLVMEYVGGADLAALMVEQRTWLSNESVADLAWQMLDVLEYIHGQSVLHRDIKPANIKWQDGRAYLLDFGLAYGLAADDMDTVDAARFNWKYRSKKYSPPEQCLRRRTTPASDLYALAATLYYLLTNVEAADAEARLESVSRGGADPLEDVRVYNPSADETMSHAVMCALSLSANRRPQSAAEMRDMIFPEADEPAPGGLRRLVAKGLFAAAFASVLLACLAFVGPKIYDTGRYVPPPTPVATATPTPSPTPTPAPAQEAAQFVGEAELARYGGDNQEAWAKCEQALELDENNPYIYFLLGDILWESITDNGESARKAEVEKYADTILGLVRSPRSAREYVARAWAYRAKASLDRAHPERAQARLDRAIADATEAINKYDPNSVAARMLRASAASLKAVRAKAGSQFDEETALRILDDSEQAVRLAPEFAQAHDALAAIHLALALRAQGAARDEHLQLARGGFEQALELIPRPQFHRDLGDVYKEMGDYDKAGESYRAALNQDENYYQAYVALGDLFLKQRRWEEAAANYLEANRRNGDSDELKGYVFRRLGTVYNMLGQFESAEKNELALKELERATSARGAVNKQTASR